MRQALIIVALLAAMVTGSPFVRAAPEAKPDARQMRKALEPKAVEQIVTSAQSEDAYLRANAIEAAQALPKRVVPLVQLAVDDKDPVVRFAALATIGRLKLEALSESARSKTEDPNESVRAAALFALRANGRKADISPLSQMLTSADPASRGNAALLLGWLGDKSAVPMLKELSKVPMARASDVRANIVRLQYAEAIARLGDDEALTPIRAAVYSQYPEVQVLAVQILGRLNDQRMTWRFAELIAEPPVELQLAAAEALARQGMGDGLQVALTAATNKLPTARAQAALVLGLINDPSAMAALGTLLTDPEEQVRLSAAAAIVGKR